LEPNLVTWKYQICIKLDQRTKAQSDELVKIHIWAKSVSLSTQMPQLVKIDILDLLGGVLNY
jgi:hypothetical protein